MRLRSQLFLFYAVVLLAVVFFVAAGVTTATRHSFEQQDAERSEAVVAQFQREFQDHGQEVLSRVQGVAQSDAVTRMAIDLSRPNGDPSVYVNDATGLAASYRLDFLNLLSADGSIISSFEWPARFGYKLDWITQLDSKAPPAPFLQRVDLQEGAALGLLAVVPVSVNDNLFFVVGGIRLDRGFLASLSLLAGTRVLLCPILAGRFSSQDLAALSGAVPQPEKLAALISRAGRESREVSARIGWTSDPADAEAFHALPLLGRGHQLLGVLLVGSSRRSLVLLERRIRWMALAAGLGGLLMGLIFIAWFSGRISRPVARLSAGAREVAAGNWKMRITVRAQDEIGRLTAAFNQMAAELAGQQERLLQAERVAAWRELARRLAHELKNPLFPLQITIENLRRSREQGGAQFDEVFSESTVTLLAELENLKTIVGRFSEFARMPAPELRGVQLNEIVHDVARLFEAQFSANGRSVVCELQLDSFLPAIQADPHLMRRALENLVLNALDAMPNGGTLTLQTHAEASGVTLAVSDSGAGLTPEEQRRLFTPYYTSHQHGTGLGLAIVQSVVSDHGGTISVASEQGRGTTFLITLPLTPPVQDETARTAVCRGA